MSFILPPPAASINTTSTTTSVPVFVLVNSEDDVSVISFGTGTSSSDDFGDSESRWALESMAAHCHYTVNTTGTHYHEHTHTHQHPHNATSPTSLNGNDNDNARQRPSLISNQSPAHPERSLSLSTCSPTSPQIVTLRRKPLARTTRLTRMAERAKATRKANSLRFPSHHRHSLPAIPLRRKSSNSRSFNTCSICSTRSGEQQPAATNNACRMKKKRCGRLSNSCRIPTRAATNCGGVSSRIPTRRNSIQCITVKRDGIVVTAPPRRKVSSAPPAVVVTETANTTSSSSRSARRATGCFQIACAATASTNRPPRLPQRYPSEILLAPSN